jgi:NAD(P)-dependent dehydrogenase (short-subunit alcohol dehydrogenase family)
VAIVDRNEELGARTAAELPEALFTACDVRDEASVIRAVTAVRERFGALHVLINGAGILEGAFTPVADLAEETFARVLDVNALGTFLFCKHAVPLIEASGGGVVLCISSGGGVSGPSSSLAYGASKAAVQGFCRTLEQQLQPKGIRVNVVCPGSLNTQMKRRNLADKALAEGRAPEAVLAEVALGDPDGVAKVLAFLASDEADYVRGTVFTR